MSLNDDLHLNIPIQTTEHEAFLNMYFTGTCIRKKAAEFLSAYGLTDVQFNLMLMLRHQGGDDGLAQSRLSEMMLVNRANITGLVDRLERDGLVKRTGDPNDRRTNLVILTAKGKRLIEKVNPLYDQEVCRIMDALSKKEFIQLIEMLEKIRKNL